ncbi:hypothetical protein VNO77_23865 [Canavalia gladiata]|uniref:Uncharacterized protein n=1 Tax=Canavalia gladiata TaxID=3824 RepID=A0AAN9Q9C2_CANGL
MSNTDRPEHFVNKGLMLIMVLDLTFPCYYNEDQVPIMTSLVQSGQPYLTGHGSQMKASLISRSSPILVLVTIIPALPLSFTYHIALVIPGAKLHGFSEVCEVKEESSGIYRKSRTELRIRAQTLVACSVHQTGTNVEEWEEQGLSKGRTIILQNQPAPYPIESIMYGLTCTSLGNCTGLSLALNTPQIPHNPCNLLREELGEVRESKRYGADEDDRRENHDPKICGEKLPKTSNCNP